MLSRRDFGLMSAASMAAAGCATPAGIPSADGRLSARPAAPTSPGNRFGSFRLEGWPRPLVFIPPDVDAMRPAPLVLVLHGGGSDAAWTLNRMLGAARDKGVILLAPQAEGYTWDAVRQAREHRRENAPPRFGDDTARVDASLKLLFDEMPVDPAHIAIAGFSDGASYALSLGPRNGELFSHIMAFSPGGVAPFDDPARARVFISHGRQDPMLPYANTADGIIPGLRSRGYDVTFETFNGVHAFRDEEVGKAFDWFLAR
ncbi:MAG TPA: alpha/beta hydrolase-fold protein [Hyphomonadaceae bacterium]|nr:alpha/beta hydrolase-fold protein [Hyphomonadaceae bacterium]